MRSAAFQGGGYVLVEFQPQTNLATALQDTRSKVQDGKADLPRDPSSWKSVAAPVSCTTQRVALPQLSTSPPSLFQMRILRSAMVLGSSTIS